MTEIKITGRLKRVFNIAENEAGSVITSAHILLAVFLEQTGALEELFVKIRPNIDEMRKKISLYDTDNSKGISHSLFKKEVSNDVNEVILESLKIMSGYNQVVVNEGNVIEAIFKLKNAQIVELSDGMDLNMILKIAASGRDLIVGLNDYEMPNLIAGEIDIRRATISDKQNLTDFIERTFSKRWSETIFGGLSRDLIPIHIAIKDNQIVGFAGFDVWNDKKGVFGPM